MEHTSCNLTPELGPTFGYIAQADVSHSLTPARNCTFGCTYCYVPTMGIYSGLKPDDWHRSSQFTTFKNNPPELLHKQLRGDQVIYYSPLVDPYQPAEAEVGMMPRVLDELIERPPKIFPIQTHGTLIARYINHLVQLTACTERRARLSLAADREDIHRLFEPYCATWKKRLAPTRLRRENGIRTIAALAPPLPCNSEHPANLAFEATTKDVIGDPFHVRAVNRYGATTNDARTIREDHGFMH